MTRALAFFAFAVIAACGAFKDGGANATLADAGADAAPPDDGTCPGGWHVPPGACYAAVGSCAASVCAYAFQEGAACDDGDPCTAGDTCTARACRGGEKTACDGGANDGGLTGDGGACGPCTAPPASACNGASVTTYDPTGTCVAGACAYTPHPTTCAKGCANGLCVTGGWVSPGSVATVDLHGVWGSAANAVWAVGVNGTALFWNGTQWQSRSSGTFDNLWAIHGSGASNVFAVGIGGGAVDVFRFDGASWKKRATLPNYDPAQPAIFALGDDDALVYVTHGYADQPGDLWRVTGGSAQKLGTSNVNQGNGNTGLWAFSATDVWITGTPTSRWNGATFAPASSSAPTGGALWGLSPDFVFLGWLQSPWLWDATHQWTLENTGATGITTGFGGTSTTRVFASVADVPYTGTGTGRVARFDGLGWTPEPIPAGTYALYGIWAAPTGEVFSVGEKGAIVMGP